MIPRLDDSAWSRPAAAHLLNRAGFGGTPAEVSDLHRKGLRGAVAHLLDGAGANLEAPKPEGIGPRDMLEFRQSLRDLDEEARQKARQELRRSEQASIVSLTEWWLGRMRGKGDAVAEKLTLFWHGHFATSVEKVKSGYLMWVQNDTLRRQALGNFGTMTKAISRDPAMLVWLDTARSNMRQPNENFARELMELFTLGEGNYSEEDIREAARAFTGYKINQRDQSFRQAPAAQTDRGAKTFFRKKGNFDGDDVVDLILSRTECAPFIAAKLWKYYATDVPAPDLVKALGEKFRADGYEIRPLLETIFTSRDFYAGDAVRSKVKSPVEWLIGMGRVLEIDLPPGPMMMTTLAALGQVPFRPPSVKGWDGGKAWITTATLLLRYNLAGFAMGSDVPMGGLMRRGNPRRLRRMQDLLAETLPLEKIAPPEVRADPGKLVATLIDRLFQSALPPRETATFIEAASAKMPFDDDEIRALLQLMMSTPQFQLT